MAEDQQDKPAEQKKQESKQEPAKQPPLSRTLLTLGGLEADSRRRLSTISDILLHSSSVSLPASLTATRAFLPSLLSKSEREQQLEQEISSLKNQLSAQQKALQEEIKKGEGKQSTLDTLEITVKTLAKKEQLSFVLNRIHDEAKQVFLESPEFQDEFLSNKPDKHCEAYVMAVDLRRSTEMMLKSRRPELFAEFIMELTSTLRQIVLEHHGVFDKFTGDGILAFFPEFYTGSDAGYHVMSAAQECHEAFTEHYRRNFSCFYTVMSMKDVGLGIGIDYGEISLVQVGQELAMVGNPVVYACRMGGTRAGNTLLNQPAYEKVNDRFSMYCSLTEDEIDIKHEGLHVAYSVRRNEREFIPAAPAWRKFAKAATPEA